MLEIFQNFEQMAARLAPSVLIGSGAAAVLIGLVVWLGGLRLKKVLVAIVGAAGGGVLGFVVISPSVLAATISAAVAAVVAIIFERALIAMLAAALAGAFGFVFLVGPYIQSSQATDSADPALELPAQDYATAEPAAPSVDGSIAQLKAYAVDVGGQMKQACSQMPLLRWAMMTVSAAILVAVLAAISIAGRPALWRLTSALCFSVFGTILIFAGMIFLLSYKGAAPVSHIGGRPLIYAGVFAAMAAFGTFEQLLFCRRAKPESAKKGKAGKDKEATDRKQKGWRTTDLAFCRELAERRIRSRREILLKSKVDMSSIAGRRIKEPNNGLRHYPRTDR
jgi:hypothetical protein